MKKSNSKIAVIIMGQPGAGKGTQADLLARKRNFFHFDTGQYFEQVIFNPKLQKNPIIKEQRHFFETGKLFTPSWILNQMAERIKDIARAGFSIVLSGSPRTLYEAFGDKGNPGLIKILEKFYGKKNIDIFFLKASPEESIRRNSHRLICSICELPLLSSVSEIGMSYCPFCGGKLIKRVLDKPEIIKERLKEFQRLTMPVILGLKKKYKIISVDSKGLPFTIHKRINDSIKNA